MWGGGGKVILALSPYAGSETKADKTCEPVS